MIAYVVQRLMYMIPMLIVISTLSFALLQLMPGDFLTELRFDPNIDQEQLAREAARLGLDQHPIVQYWHWISGVVRGDFGLSFATRRPAFEALFGANLERLGWTVRVSLLTFLFTWIVSIPIGIYSATHQYKVSDHAFTAIAFFGMSIPNFFFALVLLWILVVPLQVGRFGLGISGVVAPHLLGEPWSWTKLGSFLWHVWPALLVIGTAGMAGLVRVMRGLVLDTLGEQYVLTARSKGLSERAVLYKHAVRNAINPLVTGLGMGLLQGLIAGELIASMVFNLPTVSRAWVAALMAGDQYVVLGGLVFFSFLLLFGNLLADFALAWVDPRIRHY